MSGWRIGVDIGGTFTDIVALAGDGSVRTKKISSSVQDYAQAIATGLAELFLDLGIDGKDVVEIRHGTTVASNAILEHKGARTGLITTQGFRDVLEIRNLRMPRLYDLAWEKPEPLVPRYLRTTVPERITAAGEVQLALSSAEAEAAVQRLLDEKVEAIAVCLLNSFVNPAHELLLKETIERLAPGLPYSISFEVLPEIKEYERTSTTVINAYVKPVVAGYLARLRGYLATAGVQSPRAPDAVERRPHDGRGGGREAHAHHRERARQRASSAPRPSPRRWGSRTSSASTWAAPPPRRRSSRTAASPARSSIRWARAS